MIKPFKIKVVNESHSREIQEWLFSLGYYLCDGRTNVSILHAKYLFFSKDEGYKYPTISLSACPKIFKESDLPEAWFYDGKIRYEPKPTTLPEFKIKVESPEHSRKIQEFVFSMGYTWWTMFNEPNQEVKHLDEEYLYFKKSGIKNKIALSATSNSKTFNSLNIPEMWFYNGKLREEPSQLEPQTQPKPQKVETTMSSKKTYRQLAEAMLSGQKLQFLDISGDWISMGYIGLHASQLDKEFPHEVRVKSRTCNNVELDPCLESEPEMDSYYYYPDPTLPYFYDITSWRGSYQDQHLLKSGMIYLHINSAVKHGKAMVITDDN